MSDSNEKLKFQYNGLKWLQEMQLVTSPQFVNHLKLNILKVSTTISECEFLISQEHQAVLVYLELNWFGRLFKKKSITEEVKDVINFLLPSWQYRIVYDRSILELSLNTLKARGVSNETITDNSDT